MSDQNPVETLDTAQVRLKELYDTSGKGWREIAALREFSPIPAGTLRDYAVEGREPRSNLYRFKLGLPPILEVTGLWCAREICRHPFLPKSRNHKYCSRRCRWKARRERKD